MRKRLDEVMGKMESNIKLEGLLQDVLNNTEKVQALAKQMGIDAAEAGGDQVTWPRTQQAAERRASHTTEADGRSLLDQILDQTKPATRPSGSGTSSSSRKSSARRSRPSRAASSPATSNGPSRSGRRRSTRS